jgi:hypothetical protein
MVVSDPQAYIDAGLTLPEAVWGNDRYSVFVRDIGEGAMHISLHRRDRQPVRDWRHLQQIKNEVAGPERTAVEIFPPESVLVDSANEYHLFVVPPGTEVPFLLGGERFVLAPEDLEEHLGGKTQARQRAWEPGLTTGLGERVPA